MRKTIKNNIASPIAEEEIHFQFTSPTPENPIILNPPQDGLDEYIKTPMENAADALKNLKDSLSAKNAENAHLKAMREIKESIKSFKLADCPMPGDYAWYKITDIKPLADISCFGHILYNHSVISAFARYGHYLLGIRDNIICFAIPTEKNTPDPIPHLDDCTVYICPYTTDFEYCTICVALEPDGQYFMPLA